MDLDTSISGFSDLSDGSTIFSSSSNDDSMSSDSQTSLGSGDLELKLQEFAMDQALDDMLEFLEIGEDSDLDDDSDDLDELGMEEDDEDNGDDLPAKPSLGHQV